MDDLKGKMMKKNLALFAFVILAGCATKKPLYTWGHYEELLYSSYSKPGSVSPAQQIESLEADYQKARAKNLRMAPGYHAQMGILYFELGKADMALAQFEAEKKNFPESARLMDRFIGKLKTKS